MALDDDSGSDARQPGGESTLAGQIPPSPTEVFHNFDGHDTQPTPGQTSAADSQGALPEAAGPTPFEILGELGRGGVGIVYKVRQAHLGRIAALKVLAAGNTPDADAIARFRREARAVAALQHPNFVQLYEIGQWQGQAYLLLEYVPGGCLDARNRGAFADSREAARLVETIARAMHFAHQHGIVHRDLKPANVLLAADGTPKITDFGLAKELESQGQTRTGDIMGTPSYMAPEQAGGVTKSIGPACDIYSLGAILYELVAGRPPFQGQNSVETVLQVLSDDPPSLRLFAPKIPPDLETIIFKCLEKSPRQRYESAGALADDLGRFVAGEPIAARPIRPWQRAVKWARRRPATAALVAVVILAATAFVAYGIWKNRELTKALAQTEKARERAERNFAKALAASAERLDRAGQDFHLLVQEELDFFKEIYDQPGDDADTNFEKALARKQAGEICTKLRDFTAAKQSLDISINLLEQLARQAPDSLEYGRELAASRASLGSMLVAHGDDDAAAAEFHRALDQFEQLSRRAADDKLLDSAQGTLWNNLALLETRRKRFDQAEDDFRKALEIQQLADQAAADARWSDGHWHDLAATHVNLSSLYLQTDRTKAAADELLRALAIYDQAPQFRTERQYREGQASTLKKLGTALVKLRQFERSRQASHDALVRFKRLASEFPDFPLYAQMAADTEADLGTLAAMAGEPARAAIDHYRAAADDFQKLIDRYPKSPEYPLAMIANLYNIRLLQSDAKDAEAARRVWNESLAVARRAAAAKVLSPADLQQETRLMLLRNDPDFPALVAAVAAAAPPEDRPSDNSDR